MNHSESRLMMAIQLKYFDKKKGRKKENGGCKFINSGRFLFDMSPDVPVFKVRVLTSEFNFELG